MLIFVDGYNLLHAWEARGVPTGQKQREELLALLARFARVRDHTIQVVFDGGMFSWAETEPYDTAISVTFSGTVDNADALLKRMLSERKARTLLMVSSDREIAQWASDCGIVSIDSEAFLHIVYQRLSNARKQPIKGQIQKMAGAGNAEVDKLMLQALGEKPVPQKDFDADISAGDVTPSVKKSRQEKRMHAILKRL